MILLPFFCLGVGILLEIYIKNKKLKIYSERISTVALALLIFIIGVRIVIENSTSWRM